MRSVLGVNLYDLREVAEMLGVSYSTVRNYIKESKLEALKIGSKLYVNEENIKGFISGGNTISKKEE